MRAGYRCRRALGTSLVAAALVTTACGGAGRAAGPAPTGTRPSTPPPSEIAAAASAAPAPSIDPAAVHANELGVVPVLMYHQIVRKPRGIYDQTPEQFRAELTRLYREGYRTITAADLAAARIDVPAGKSPMVLTFDDATRSQYAELPDGSLDPTSGLGILFAVAKAYGEGHPVATFYVNQAPFGGHDAYLAKLHDMGMEIGDHTRSHANLRQLSDADVQAEVSQGRELIVKAVPGIDVTTMALPFGVFPQHHALASRGSSGGVSYAFQAVMLVGAGPSPSPFRTSFDPLGIPRLLSGRDKSQPFASTFWLDRIRTTRYISDGDPTRISFPKAAAASLLPRFASMARPY